MNLDEMNEYEFRARVRRALDETFYLLDTRENPTAFVIRSAKSNNIYAVECANDGSISCECQDFQKRHATCKHIIFVIVRRLGMSTPPANAKLSATDLERLNAGFSQMRALPASAQLDSVRLGNAESSENARRALAVPPPTRVRSRSPVRKNVVVLRKPLRTRLWESEPCPICLEDLPLDIKDETLEWCHVCEKGWHHDCFDAWTKFQRFSSHTCFYCRSKL